jgi:Tfp pilus assembly protein PilZ
LRIYAHQNRRRSHRVYLRTRIDCRASRGQAHAGSLGNLGGGGLFIHAPAPYPVGTRLRLAFRVGDAGAARAIGEIVWIRRHGADRLPGFGIRFAEIAPAHARAIGRFLERRLDASRRLLRA